MNILNINFTSFFLDLTYFSSQFNNDMDIYLIMIIALAILAIGDLVVGVSNDAVNFLNSALGSKAISVRNIMILASLGVAVGAVFSSGMMEVARKGILDHDGIFFAYFLRTNKVLRKMELEGNNLGPLCAFAFGRVLCENKALRFLDLESN